MPIMKLASTFCNILYTSTEINENGNTLFEERFPDYSLSVNELELELKKDSESKIFKSTFDFII